MSKHFAIRDFNDAGTGRSFKAGEEIKDVPAGPLGNYEAAGLVADAAPKGADPIKTTEGGKTA